MRSDGLRKQGNEKYSAKLYKEAVDAYTSALEALALDSDADDCRAQKLLILTNRATAYYQMGDYQASLNDAVESISVDPTRNSSHKAVYRAGLASLMLGQHADAAKRFSMLSNPIQAKTSTMARCWNIDAEEIQALLDRATNFEKQRASMASIADNADEINILNPLIYVLEQDIDGESEIDVHQALQALATALRTSPVTRKVFWKDGAVRFVWFYFTEAFCNDASAVLKASMGHPIDVPTELWARLVSLAEPTGSDGSATSAAALDLLYWAAESDYWIKTHVFTHPLLGRPELVPLQWVVKALAAPIARQQVDRHGASSLSPAAAMAAAKLLACYAYPSNACAALRHLSCRPLQLLLKAFEFVSNSSSSIASKATSAAVLDSLAEEEAAARKQLLEKQRTVYDADAVKARKSLLQACCTLAGASRDLILDEATSRKPNQPAQASGCCTTTNKNCKLKLVAGPLVPLLLRVLRQLVETSPKRTVAVLGPDLQPAAYTKRRFAADFVDNPTGDYLVGLDLSGTTPEESETGSHTAIATDDTLTQLELCLKTTLKVCLTSAATAAACYRAGLLGLVVEACQFVSPSVVELAQRICAALCDLCPAVAEEALQGDSVLQLAGIAKFCQAEHHVCAALDGLTSYVDACSGDDFKVLTGQHGVLQCALRATVHRTSSSKEPGKRLILQCAERAQRCQGAMATCSGGWAQLDREQLNAILKPVSCGSDTTPSVKTDSLEGLANFKRGFLGRDSNSLPNDDAGIGVHERNHKEKISPRSTLLKAKVGHTPTSAVTYANGVTIEDITETAVPVEQAFNAASLHHEHNGTKLPAIAETHKDNAGEENADTIPDLRDVYDSSPAQVIRQTRAVWMAVPLKDRVRWEQTSTDVSAWIAVPMGTSAREVSVQVHPNRLTLSLGWYGKVVDGPLHGQVKAREATWCLEDGSVHPNFVQNASGSSKVSSKGNAISFPEIHVMLPKDGAGRWWKALFLGGEERGYYELLQEAVNADEPTPAYDELEEGAKDLLESLLERQAMVNAGLIDLENGFDDFRLVIGENSLTPGGATSSGV